MATKAELNNFYQSLYHKDFPSATLSKWTKEGRIVAKKEGRYYNYDLESFKSLVTSEDYIKKIRAHKENPKDYIGIVRNNLLITGIVPKEEYKENYKGTLMYCNCLRCGTKNIQVRFSYLTPNGNYHQNSCGCYRKQRAFLASCREGITEKFLDNYSDNFEYFLFVHKMITHTSDYYYSQCSIQEYESAIDYFINNKQLQSIYDFWKNHKNQDNTFYDWAKPSLDHIIPLSKGGTSKIDNLQVLTVFENLAKRDMSWDEWQAFKEKTHTQSDYFLENIIERGDEE